MNKPYAVLFLVLLMPVFSAHAQDETTVIKSKLDNFLANVSDYETHDDFWAEDLIYTSSSGNRFGKSTIMDGLDKSGVSAENVSSPYSAEDVKVTLYGTTAVLTFKLVNKEAAGETDQVTEYFNSGTLLNRNGQWKVVCWQATRIP